MDDDDYTPTSEDVDPSALQDPGFDDDLGPVPEAGDAASLPRIRTGLDTARVTQEASHMLSISGRTFSKGGKLVRICHVGDDSGPPIARDAPVPEGVIYRPPTMPTTKGHDRSTITDDLSKVCRFERLRKNKDGGTTTELCAPPPILLEGLQKSEREWEEVRPLAGISSIPVMRPDGTIAQDRGYDHSTGFYLSIPKDMPRVKDNPSAGDAALAISRIHRLVKDFPWQTTEDFCAWMALILTLVCRPSITGPVPLFLIQANVMGSGKSLLADIASIITCGDVASRASYTPDDAELCKMLTSVALQGDQILLLDNADEKYTIGGAGLDRWATGTIWGERRLGVNDSSKIPYTTTTIITANNPSLRADTTARVLPIRLVSTLEDPRSRTDQENKSLVPYTLTHRLEYLSYFLTIARAWAAAGMDRPCATPWGSFEGWACIVPQILVWAGQHNPMATRTTISEADPLLSAWRTLADEWPRLEALSGVTDSHGLTLRNLVSTVFMVDRRTPKPGMDGVAEALTTLGSVKGMVEVQKLGVKFHYAKDRVFKGKTVRKARMSANDTRWRIM